MKDVVHVSAEFFRAWWCELVMWRVLRTMVRRGQENMRTYVLQTVRTARRKDVI